MESMDLGQPLKLSKFSTILPDKNQAIASVSNPLNTSSASSLVRAITELWNKDQGQKTTTISPNLQLTTVQWPDHHMNKQKLT
jgi:hypothetical protein